MSSADDAIDAIAQRQRFVVAHRQLVEAGVSRRAIQHRVATGRLQTLHRGVFLVGHVVAPALAAETAALLACGPGSVLSHLSAAWCWRILERRDGPAPLHVTVPADRRTRGRTGVVIHRTGTLAAAEIRRRDGLPVTAPARTLADLAALLPERDLKWAIEEARVRRLMTQREFDGAVRAHGSKRGATALGRIARTNGPHPTATRSEAERRLLDLIAESGLPAPRANVKVQGHLVDLHWPAQGVVVEMDGYAYHAHREAFERDRRRDADLAAAGIRVIRLTWRRITAEPTAVAALLARILDLDDRRKER